MSTYGGDARGQVNGPATALLVTGIIGIVLQVLNLLLSIFGAGLLAAMGAKEGGQVGQQEQLQAMFSGTMSIIQAIVGILVGVVIILGALKMKNLESYGFAMTSSILAMIPIISPCCCLGLPFGIWSVIVLNKPEVKTAFDQGGRRGPIEPEDWTDR